MSGMNALPCYAPSGLNCLHREEGLHLFYDSSHKRLYLSIDGLEVDINSSEHREYVLFSDRDLLDACDELEWKSRSKGIRDLTTFMLGLILKHNRFYVVGWENYPLTSSKKSDSITGEVKNDTTSN